MSAPQTPVEEHLSRTLDARAERYSRLPATGLDLDAVRSRAGEIRRGRRMRATIAMAAVVLAVAVPVGITTANNDRHAPAPTPIVEPDGAPLRLDGLTSGAEPGAYAADGAVTDHGSRIPAPSGDPLALAQIEGAFLVSTSDEEGNWRASVVAAGSAPSDQSWPMTGGFAVSVGGAAGAFAEPDGTVVVITDGGERTLRLPAVPGPPGTGFDVLALAGSCLGIGGPCEAVVQADGPDPATWVTGRDTDPVLLGGERAHLTAYDGGLSARVVKETRNGWCSRVDSPEWSDGDAWKTCEHRILAFSPKTTKALASSAYASGSGDTELAVLAVDDGRPLLDLRAARGAVISSAVWEDDEHVLATVYADGNWGVVRIAMDGSRELALGPVSSTDDVRPPFRVAPAAPDGSAF